MRKMKKKNMFSASNRQNFRRGAAAQNLIFFTKLNSSFLIHKVLFSRLNQTIVLKSIMKAYAWLQGMSQRFECVRAAEIRSHTCSKIKSAVMYRALTHLS